MSPKFPPRLLKLVTDSVNEFFGSCGVAEPQAITDVSKHATPSSEAMYSSSLGFSGPQMRGAMVIMCGSSVLSQTNPQREFNPNLSDRDLADWVGEMANQIVGNLKRLVAGYSVEFQLSTPTVVRGSELQIAGKKSEDLAVLWFEVGGHSFRVHFAAELAAGVSFEGEPVVVAQAAGGDAMLF
jgi:CheY-specific phosphatase CheX